MKIAGMDIVIEEIPMTQEHYKQAVTSMAHYIAEKYLNSIEGKSVEKDTAWQH